MSTNSERMSIRAIKREFESSRHESTNLVAAFEHALPIERRRPAREPKPGRSSLPPSCQRRAVS